MVWISAQLTIIAGRKNELHLKYAYHHSCLVSDSIHIIITVSLCTYHRVAVQEPIHHSKLYSGGKYQDYYTTYKMLPMATHHGCTGCPLDRGINLNAEGPEPTDIDIESIHNSNATFASGKPEAEGQPKDPVYSNHNKLMANMRVINDLHQ